MNELAKGIRTEKEHKDVIEFIDRHYKHYGQLPPKNTIYAKIAKDHLREDPHYYSKLLKAKL